MAFIAVLTVVLLLIAALGNTWWWRPATGPWYGGSAFAWGIFFLSVYITWPTIRTLL